MTYRWLTSDEILEFVNPVCRQRGWAELNVNDASPTCRVLGAFEDTSLVGFHAIQLFPMIGPLWTDTEHRDGMVSRALVLQMYEYLIECDARGYMAVCDSPISQRFAERYGMTKLDSPVYVRVGG